MELQDHEVLIFFEGYYHERQDKIVKATEEEWERLIRPAIERFYPIDSLTVDPDLRDELYEREDLSGLVSFKQALAIVRVIPLV